LSQLEESKRSHQIASTERARTQREAMRIQGLYDDARLKLVRLESEVHDLRSAPPPEPKVVEKIKVHIR